MDLSKIKDRPVVAVGVEISAADQFIQFITGYCGGNTGMAFLIGRTGWWAGLKIMHVAPLRRTLVLPLLYSATQQLTSDRPPKSIAVVERKCSFQTAF